MYCRHYKKGGMEYEIVAFSVVILYYEFLPSMAAGKTISSYTHLFSSYFLYLYSQPVCTHSALNNNK